MSELTDAQRVAKLTADIEKASAERNAILNKGDLSSDLALERNVDAVLRCYKERRWVDLASTAAMVAELCRRNVKPQVDTRTAIREHAKMPPGVRIPQMWGAGDNSYFRFGAPILLSAKSGVGKSAGACNIAVHNYLNKVYTVYFAGEDTMAETLIKCFTVWSMVKLGRSFAFTEVEEWLHKAVHGDAACIQLTKGFHVFVNDFEKYVRIVESEYMTPSAMLIEIERTENIFGEMPKCVINDYIQINETEHLLKRDSVREQNIDKSKTFKRYVKGKPMALINVSQLNDDNRTAESTQFEKDAAQWIILEREQDKDTDELSPVLKIRMVKGRRTGSGRFICHFDGPSGAFIPNSDWSPIKKDLYARD